MNRTEAQKAIANATKNRIITDYAAAPVGCLSLIDSLYIDFTASICAEYEKMFHDSNYYKSVGGWDGWTEKTNAEHTDAILEQIYAAGFEVASVDDFDENGTLFIDVIKPNAASLEEYYD